MSVTVDILSTHGRVTSCGETLEDVSGSAKCMSDKVKFKSPVCKGSFIVELKGDGGCQAHVRNLKQTVQTMPAYILKIASLIRIVPPLS